MNSPINKPPLPLVIAFLTGLLVFLFLPLSLLLNACGGKFVKETVAETKVQPKAPPVPTNIPGWLGNPERSFYGTGPWNPGPLEIVWQLETGWISGRLHKDPWGGTSWPGQPSVDGDRVYFPSADGNVYCLNRRDGSVIWKYQARDSMKATPVILDDKILASGLDHHLYCLNAKDGSLIWDHETGFEIDGSTIVVGDRIYFGCEDHNFYCL